MDKKVLGEKWLNTNAQSFINHHHQGPVSNCSMSSPPPSGAPAPIHPSSETPVISNDSIFGHSGRIGKSQTASTQAPNITESYSVFPVGHGNFLKVYHSSDADPPQFNSYELFSNSSFIPHMMRSGASPQPPSEIHHINDGKNTNTIINQLVTNWAPNVTGNYTPFGESHIPTPPLSADGGYIKPFAEEQISKEQQQTATQTSKLNGPDKAAAGMGSTTEVKKRIVAEVKPMRMSYSDVLSKNVSIGNQQTASNGNSQQNSQNDLNTSDPNSLTNRQQKIFYEKNKPAGNSNEKRQLNMNEDGRGRFDQKPKKTDLNESRNEDSYIGQSYYRDKSKNSSDDSAKGASGNASDKNQKARVKQPLKKKTKTSQASFNDSKDPKRRNTKHDSEDGVNFTHSTDKDFEKELYYNVTKKESSFLKNPKTSSSRKTKSSNPALPPSTATQKNFYHRSEKSALYSKRQKPRKNEKYDWLMKLGEKWLEYMLKIIKWLFYLIYDIIVLGFHMAYDRITQAYYSTVALFAHLRLDMKKNYGKPSTWFKDFWKKFDGKFAKNSAWAWWRRFYKKKPSLPEQEFYKNGRLPQTGDEAMSSLLNCKGKDAYSVLGVSSDCSQEQIRKHYKKIAVLVHPDKNKQPGAEEAFKVLQRAFELIGEPENRRTYDASLAEALNAEKAWTELHDLLSQLQSKIAEAANTIRCSSCGLRHPRKQTERPHYAARECSSCKIRHSAREGDIWAETSLFGMRWRYLALMESKVYDITEWANCQKGALSHLQPNSHSVQYRIVRGGQQQQQEQQQQSHQPDKDRSKRETAGEPSLDEFLDNLFSGQNPQNQQQNNTRKRTKRN